jgi:3-isopropylmalate/(R)-2-methylmalate dehydratase small subunit
MSLVREGRVWTFGDDINTDLIFPNRAMRLPLEEQHRQVFSANRPGWVDQVAAGDLIVAGNNFGMGSGRPVGRLLAACGIAGVIAHSVNGLCLRNCVSYGLPALSAPGVADLFQDGERARVDFAAGRIENLDRNTSMDAKGLPVLFQELVESGGVIPMLIKEGWIEAEPRMAAAT